MDSPRLLYNTALWLLKDGGWSTAKLITGSQERLLNSTAESTLYESPLMVFFPLSKQNVAWAGDFRIGVIVQKNRTAELFIQIPTNPHLNIRCPPWLRAEGKGNWKDAGMLEKGLIYLSDIVLLNQDHTLLRGQGGIQKLPAIGPILFMEKKNLILSLDLYSCSAHPTRDFWSFVFYLSFSASGILGRYGCFSLFGALNC